MSILKSMSRTLKLAAGIALLSTMVACGGDPDTAHEAAAPTFKIGAATGVIEGGRVLIDASGETCRNIKSMTIEVQAENSAVTPDPSAARSYAQAVVFTVSDVFGNSRTYSVEVLVKDCSSSATSSSASSAPENSTGDPADKYVGVWDSGCQTDGENSGFLRATFSKTGRNTYSGTLQGTSYYSTDCAGPEKESTVLTNIGAAIVGTKSASGTTVDKIRMTSSEALLKVIGFSNGTTLQFGVDDDDVDAQGYPNELFYLKMNKV